MEEVGIGQDGNAAETRPHQDRCVHLRVESVSRSRARARAGASRGCGWTGGPVSRPRACAAASGPAVTRRHCAKAERAVIRHERPRRALRIAARRFVIDHSAADNRGLPLLIALKATRNRNPKNYPSKNRVRVHFGVRVLIDFRQMQTFVYIRCANVITSTGTRDRQL